MKHIYRRFILSAVLVFPVVISAGAQELAGDNASFAAKRFVGAGSFPKGFSEQFIRRCFSSKCRGIDEEKLQYMELDRYAGICRWLYGNSLWGMDEKLILVDGVPRNIDYISPTEISQITFLKGAQAVVLYGSRAAKGVIMITLKEVRVRIFK